MTLLKITFAAAALVVTLAPAASAYAIEPAERPLEQVIQLAEPAPDGACSLPIASLLATLLALPDDQAAVTDEAATTPLACASE